MNSEIVSVETKDGVPLQGILVRPAGTRRCV